MEETSTKLDFLKTANTKQNAQRMSKNSKKKFIRLKCAEKKFRSRLRLVTMYVSCERIGR